jgi:hypothetical protein
MIGSKIQQNNKCKIVQIFYFMRTMDMGLWFRLIPLSNKDGDHVISC